MRVLVTGGSRGIGLALVRAWRSRGDEVVAAVREPASASEAEATGAHVVAMDVGSSSSVAAARKALSLEALDVLVNNAGMTGGPQRAPGMDLARVAEILDVNAVGPTRVYDAFVDLLRKGTRPRLVNVSSEAGSLSAFRAGSKPEYAMSKAALNALTRWIASVERAVVCASIDPGWTRTRTGGEGAPQSTETAASRMIAAIDRLDAAHSGGFFDADLAPMPW